MPMKTTIIVILLVVILFGQVSKVPLLREVPFHAKDGPEGTEAFIEVYLKFPYYENYYSDLVVMDAKVGVVLFRHTILKARDSVQDTIVEFKTFKWEGQTLIIEGRNRYVGPTQLRF